MGKLSGEQVKAYHKRYNLQSWSKQGSINPIPVEKAEGIYIWDYEGNRYTDMSSQLVNLNVGHGNRRIIDAIKAIGLDTAKAVLNAPREMLVEKADLEEETVDHVLNVLKAEFE